MAGRRQSMLVLALAGTLAACGGGADERAAPRAQDVETVPVGGPSALQGRAWDGVVEAVRQATLSAQTSARVVAVTHDVGDRVHAGEVLVRLSAIEQQADVDSATAQLRSAQASADEAQATLARYAALAGGQYVSKLQLDQVKATRDTAMATRDAARAALAQARQTADYTIVRAPFDGIISARSVEPGESVVFGGNLIAGQTLMTVFSPDAMRIEVQVPQADAAAIAADPQARIVFADGHGVDAARVTVFPSADTGSHSVTVRVALPALDPAPPPGSTAKVIFAAAANKALPDIPATAVIHRGEVAAVYVLADGQLSMRQVRLGDALGERVRVIAGLKPGERVAQDPIAAAQALVQARQQEH